MGFRLEILEPQKKKMADMPWKSESRTSISTGIAGTARALVFIVVGMVLFIRMWLEVVNIHQPLFEGYIGRQIPTAMVARGLVNGGSFFYPQLQTGPFPSYFLVEPPIYAWLVKSLNILTGIDLDASGRIVSLTGLALACIGIGKITWRKFGPDAAFMAIGIMLSLPVSFRYGRSFQPDMLAIGTMLLGIALYDHGHFKKCWKLLTFGLILISLALATRITLVPLVLVLPGFNLKEMKSSHWKRLFLTSLFVPIPAMVWYGWAAWLASVSPSQSGGQSGDGLKYWIQMVGPLALFSRETIQSILPNILWRSWTPFWIVILPAIVSQLWHDRWQRRWMMALACWLILVGAKSHHAYYWLVPAPLIAMTGAAWACGQSSEGGRRPLRFWILLVWIILGFYQSRSTWITPVQWQALETDLSEIRKIIQIPGQDGFLISHEASIYAVGCEGLRWEWSDLAQERAISAWGEGSDLASGSPLKLLDFYLDKGGRWFLALENDPDWPGGKQALEVRLTQSRVVYQKGGLILYEFDRPNPLTGDP